MEMPGRAASERPDSTTVANNPNSLFMFMSPMVEAPAGVSPPQGREFSLPSNIEWQGGAEPILNSAEAGCKVG